LEGDRVDESKTIRVLYFAMLREQRGCREEEVSTTANNAGELYQDLCNRHGLTATPSSLRLAINDEFKEWQEPLKHGDVVTFIPPVAGG
jgi:molybdopterin converting factor subunit 1